MQYIYISIIQYSYTFLNYIYLFLIQCWLGSSVGIATDYGLDGPVIESQWGKIFCTCPDQPPV
jgi:hypothetical protein